MATFELGQIIAEREYRFELAAGSAQAVTIKLGMPVPDPADPQRTWLCPYQILGIGRDRVHAIFGADSFQALGLALHTIPAELAAYARELRGKFLFHDHADTTLLSGCRTALEYAADAFPSNTET